MSLCRTYRSLDLVLAPAQAAHARAQAPRLRCGPPGAPDTPPWTISQLLSRHQQCQIAAVDLPHFCVAPADDAIGCADQSCMMPQLVYLRLAPAPQQWAFGGQLRVLDVCGYSACEYDLPGSIAACTGLRHLRLLDRQLRSLPDSISGLDHLETLILTDCTSLAQLPSSIGCLQRLQILYLGNCQAFAAAATQHRQPI